VDREVLSGGHSRKKKGLMFICSGPLLATELVTSPNDFYIDFTISDPNLLRMTERLTAPARSPLRRAFAASGKESPNRPKKSPLQRPGRKSPLKKQEGTRDADAEALRAQAEEIEHDINHLSPALQRFWQVRPEFNLCQTFNI
jgi:hypothetical protein